MPLNQVQVAFVNEAARPHMEALIRALHELDTFGADWDALQGSPDAIPETDDILDDNADGTAPREDAPTLTGNQIKTLRDLSVAMSAEVSPAVKEVLISKMVRSLGVVLGVR